MAVEALLCPLSSPHSGEGAGGSRYLAHSLFTFTDLSIWLTKAEREETRKVVPQLDMRKRRCVRGPYISEENHARCRITVQKIFTCASCAHLLQSGSTGARLCLSNQIKEALRVSSLTGSAFDLPVFPMVKSFYASTNTFLSQVRTDSQSERIKSLTSIQEVDSDKKAPIIVVPVLASQSSGVGNYLATLGFKS